MQPLELGPQLAYLAVLVVSLSAHELAHAMAATLLGDDTAKGLGRLTLNPLAHLDFLGSIVLPLMGLMSSGLVIGWAKPVPVNVRNLKLGHIGHGLVAIAGPFANIFLAVLCVTLTSLTDLSASWFSGPPEANNGMLKQFFLAAASTNATLAVFNLVPLPPLDGGAVLMALLPAQIRRPLAVVFQKLGSTLLVGFLFAGGFRLVGEAAHAVMAWLTG
jgi:Zn-dependent protease